MNDSSLLEDIDMDMEDSDEDDSDDKFHYVMSSAWPKGKGPRLPESLN